ncbi:GtrA family protein [Algoriphagus litoralis]|uniref:GtrA family protein n=1 Tax=Algoriphagus litoralis TaxID=2202829 RepID=UPI000DBA65AA|nr:GtrA family protein [Algoriphagus litoralis]
MVKETLSGISKMALWGVPGYLLAFGLNYTFNDLLHWNVYLSYFLVSVMVTTLNFFIIDQIVFKGDKGKSQKARILGYLSVVYTSKIGEWAFYSLLIWRTSIHYLLVQLITSLVFIFYKYFFLKKVHG